MDDGSQVSHAAALVIPIAIWLRDEEASGPARVARHRTIRAWPGVIRLSA